MGLEPQYFPDHTGVWAMLRGEKAPGRTVTLRAEYDGQNGFLENVDAIFGAHGYPLS